MTLDIVDVFNCDDHVAPVWRVRPPVDTAREASTNFTVLDCQGQTETYAATNVSSNTSAAGLQPDMTTVTSTETVAEHSMNARAKILATLKAGMPHAAGFCDVTGLDGTLVTLYMRVTKTGGTYDVTSWPLIDSPILVAP